MLWYLNLPQTFKNVHLNCVKPQVVQYCVSRSHLYILDESSTQHQQSSTCLLIATPSNNLSNSTTMSLSQSNHDLLQKIISFPSLIFQSSQVSHNFMFCFEFKNIRANTYFKLSSPHQASSKRLVFFPSPIFHSTIPSNHLSCSLPHTNFKSLHQIIHKTSILPHLNPSFFESSTLTRKSPLQ